MFSRFALSLPIIVLTLCFHSLVYADTSVPFATSPNVASTEAERAVTEASHVYREFLKKSSLPPSVLQNAKCVAVFPSFVTAAFAIGGTSGHGIGFCKMGATGWSNPVFLKLTGGSFGFQIGYQSSDMVLFMSSDAAVNSMKNGSFNFSQDATALAGSDDDTEDSVRNQTIAYTSTDGLFLGASLSGVIIDRDLQRQQSMDGSLSPAAVFESRVPSGLERIVKDFKRRLPA